MKKRIMSLMLTVLLILGLIPSSVMAADRDATKNQVHVIVENTTYTPEVAEETDEEWTSSCWQGRIVDTWVTLKPDSSMMSCIVEALTEKGYTQVGADNNYIQSINGMGEFDGGPMSGWMGTLNDWFVNEGFKGFSVENGKLEADDEIKVMYSVTGYGADLGGDYYDTSTLMKAIEFSAGTLNQTFSPDVKDYVLNVPTDVEAIKITPTAKNKNFQVHTRIGDTLYKRTKMVPVSNGTKITITVGDGEAMSMEKTPTVYNFTVNKGASQGGDPSPNPGTNPGTDPSPNPGTNPETPTPSGQGVEMTEELAAHLKEVAADVKKTYEDTRAFLINQAKTNKAIVGSVGGEWWIVGLARDGAKPELKEFYEEYYKTVEQHVKDTINKDERLHKAKATENERVILALTALGYDVTNVGGHNLLQGLNSMKYLKKQGINGPIWGLIAFDTGNYEIPGNSNADDVVTRDKLVDYILSVQTSDGGWALMGDKADPDMTGMAMQALAPYYNKREDVKKAFNRGVDVMISRLSDNGGFASYYGEDCSESVAQVLVALTAVGIDPLNDTRFVKNGHSVMEMFKRFFVEGGGFKHVLSGSRDGMATEQAFYTLVAYNRMVNGQTSLYNMTDVLNPNPDPTPDPTPVDPDPTPDPKPQEEVSGVKPSEEVVFEAVKDLKGKINEGESSEPKQSFVPMVTEEGEEATVIPAEVLETVKGHNIDVYFEMENYSWMINGKDITDAGVKSINLSVEKVEGVVPEDVVAKISNDNPTIQLRLAHNGEFGFKGVLRYNFGTEYTGKYANIYWYKEDGTTEITTSGLVDEDGFAELTFTHASDYVVVLSDENRAEGVLDAEITGNDADVTTSPQTGDSFDFTLVLSLFVLCIIAGTAATLKIRRTIE